MTTTTLDLGPRRRPSTRASSFALLLLVGLLELSLARAAYAEPTPGEAAQTRAEARALVEAGISLRKQGLDEQALETFVRAYALVPDAKTQTQIGLAHQALGHWVAAEEHLTAAISNRGEPWIASNAATLTAALAVVQSHLGTLEVAVGSANAEALIDGRSITASKPLRLPAGKYSLEVRKEGHYPVVRRIEVLPGETTRESVELNEIAVAPTRPVAVTLPPRRTPLAANPQPETKAPAARPWKWVAFGGSIAFLGAGTVALLARQGAVSDYNGDGSCPGTRAAEQPPHCDEQLSRGRTYGILGAVGLGVGASLAGTGAVLLLLERSKTDEALACGGSPFPFGVACRARF